eukprot:11621515-Alexandrium_andersonii.AAC.1
MRIRISPVSCRHTGLSSYRRGAAPIKFTGLSVRGCTDKFIGKSAYRRRAPPIKCIGFSAYRGKAARIKRIG